MALLDPLPLSTWQIVAVLGVPLTYKVLSFIRRLLIVPLHSPICDLPGPDPHESYFWGNMKLIFNAQSGAAHQEWLDKYGPTISYRGLFMAPKLCTMDTRAISHVLTHAYEFPKPEIFRENISRVFGPGIVFAEGADHRRQRKILNPCFGPAQLRELMPIFYRKAFELREVWLEELREEPDGKTLDVLQGMTRVTLDIIGLAGFDYAFDAVAQGETNELIQAFKAMFPSSAGGSFFRLLAFRFPILANLPTKRAREVKRSSAVLTRVGNDLVRRKKADVLAGQQSVEKKAFIGRDLLSAIIKANMAVDVRESERLTDEEVVGQITTMMIAGHETSSASLTWLFYDLAKPENQHIQDRLRAEVLAVASDEPTIEELNALPYLEAVVRENLRKNTVADSTFRSSTEDTVIPVSRPFIDRKGVERNEIRLQKGDQIFIPIVCVNHDKTIWGEDADKFRPERWLEPNSHPRANEIPGVFGNQLSFLGGPRACIGYRMALLESKVLIFTLIRSVDFELSDPTLNVERRASIVTRPAVKQADGTMKNMMPLRLKPVRSA